MYIFVRSFEKRDVLWKHLSKASGRLAVSTGFIKLGEYVGGHNISTKFYNLPIPPRHSWIMALELSKNWIGGICSPSQIYHAPKNVVITIVLTTNTTGVLCVSLALLFKDMNI